MSEQTNNIQNNPEETLLTELEEKFCDLYVNGGVGFAGHLGKCYTEVFGENASKRPGVSANYLIQKPHIYAHIKTLLSSERFEMETMAVKLQVTETLKAVMDETATTDYRPLWRATFAGSAPCCFGQCSKGSNGYFPHQAQRGEQTAYRGC